MILALCMAGYNTRFHNAGFDVPKYLLPWDDGAIVSGILRGMAANENFSKILLLPNQRDRYFKDGLLNAVAPFGIGEADIAYIPDTRGQAHTAAIAAQMLISSGAGADREPIAFHNADTLIVGRNLASVSAQLSERDAYVDVFPASSPAYSYVALQDGRVSRIREKVVISPFASSGFYAFRSGEAFLNAFERHAAALPESAGETYISDVIQTMIDEGADVFINELDQASSTIVLGKPEEYGLELARRALLK